MSINHYLSFCIGSLAAYQLHSSFTVVDMITLNRLQQKVKYFVSNRAKFSSEKKNTNSLSNYDETSKIPGKHDFDIYSFVYFYNYDFVIVFVVACSAYLHTCV